MKTLQTYFPHLLLFVYIVEFIVLGVNPYDRAVWYAENIPILLYVLFFVIAYLRGVRFSNLAYFFAMVLPFYHTIGGHFTFERVPFDWFNSLFGFERNMFDRVGHFTAGFSAYALAEYVLKYKKVNTYFWAGFLGVCFIGTFAMTYELIEWVYAVTQGGENAADFLGSQGDIWDAQKDMLMDTLGAIFVIFIGVFTLRKRSLQKK
jgi:putative membrane protein